MCNIPYPLYVTVLDLLLIDWLLIVIVIEESELSLLTCSLCCLYLYGVYSYCGYLPLFLSVVMEVDGKANQ